MPFDPKSKQAPPGAEGPGGKEPVAAILLKLKGHGADGDGGGNSGPPGGALPSAEAGGPPSQGGEDPAVEQAQQDLEHGAGLLMQAVHAGNPQAIAQAFMAMFMVAQQVAPDDSSDVQSADEQSGPPEAGGESEG
jgi:hypothetical protein